MPVHKCPNGKFRIGNGKCMYDSKEKAERAYKAYIAQKHKIYEMKKEILEEKRDMIKIQKELENNRKWLEACLNK